MEHIGRVVSGDPMPSTAKVVPESERYQVAICVADEDKELAWAIYHALRDEGIERIYFYEANTSVPRKDHVIRDWESVCRDDKPFYIIIYSQFFEKEEGKCNPELDCILCDPRMAAELAAQDLRPYALVKEISLLTHRPALDDSWCYFIPFGPGVSRDTVIEKVIARVASVPVSEENGTLITRCRRRHLLKTWNKPAVRQNEHWKPPFDADHHKDLDQLEPHLALAAAVGINQQICRALKVVKALSTMTRNLTYRLVPDAEAWKGQLKSFSLTVREVNGIKSDIDQFLELFDIDESRYSYSWDYYVSHRHSTIVADQDRRLHRFGSYLRRHIGIEKSMLSVIEETERVLHDILNFTIPRGERISKRFAEGLIQLKDHALALITWMGNKLSKAADQSLGEGDLVDAARAFSLRHADHLRKDAPYHG